MAVKNSGMNHIGLMTHDIDKTIDFYQNVLGFEPMAYYLRDLQPGHVRQVFFDLGNGQSLEFLQAHNVDAIPKNVDVGINDGLGIGRQLGVGLIHFAFNVDTMDELAARKADLEEAGYEVLGPLDLDWMHSIYFTDPNGVQLEFAFTPKDGPNASYLEPVKTEQWRKLKQVAQSPAKEHL